MNDEYLNESVDEEEESSFAAEDDGTNFFEPHPLEFVVSQQNGVTASHDSSAPLGPSKDDASYTSFTVSQKCITSLMRLLDSMGCPDHAFPSIMQWALDSKEAGFDFDPPAKTRNANLKWMYDALHNSHQMLPSLKTIKLPVPTALTDSLDVICYDIVPQVLSLLQDKKVITKKNSLLDPANPLGMFKPKDGRLGDSLTGALYRDMYQRLVTNPQKQLLCPLIAFTDGTQIDMKSRFGAEPFIFSLAILTEAFRRTPSCWRPLGYVQSPPGKMRAKRKCMLSPTDKMQNYHAQLAKMLEGLQQAQRHLDPRVENVEIWLFGEKKVVDLLLPILFINTDTPAAEKLCGHMPGSSIEMQRVPVSCDCPTDKLDDPFHRCNPVTWKELNRVATEGTQEELSRYSMYRCTNCFTEIEVGYPRSKIYGAVPTDPMHSLRKGAMKRAMQVIFDCLSKGEKKKLDQMAQKFHRTHRQSARKLFPQTDFSNGVTNLSNTTAKEDCGSVFLLICLAQSNEGWALISRAWNQNDKSMAEALHALEALVCFDAWTKLDTYWPIEHQELYAKQADDSLRTLLNTVKESLPRLDGNGWKLPTYHNCTHIVREMCKNGKPMESDCSVGESTHKMYAKIPGRRCRKQHKTFATQVSQRLSDGFVTTKLARAMGIHSEYDENESNSNSQSTDEVCGSMKGATHYTLSFSPSEGSGQIQWTTKTEEELIEGRADVYAYILQTYKELFGVRVVNCCTEYTYNHHVLRCHPFYSVEGPWYNWVNVHFAECEFNGKTYEEGIYPAKVYAVVPMEKNNFLQETEIVIHCADSRTQNDSVLFTEWKLMDGFFRVPVQSVESQVFVVELDKNKIAACRPYSEWPSEFTDTTSYNDTESA